MVASSVTAASLAPFLLAIFGGVIVAREILSLLFMFYKTLLRPGKNLKKAYGEWAVVTGSTDGIGKAMAFEMARKGLNVVLVGRSVEKLAAVKEECSAKYPKVSVKTEVVDFASFSVKDAQRITDMLSGIEVGVLVNNVGISYAFPQWYHELTDDEISSLMTINMQSVVWFTRAVLPQMLSRKRGAVVNMSSASARPPNPLLTVYSSTKGFIENFTKSLALEYASKGISFQCQSPLYVATSIVFPGSKVRHPAPFDCDRMAGLECPLNLRTPCRCRSRSGPRWPHRLQRHMHGMLSHALGMML